MGIVGYPNVGKSSLINSLKRARTCTTGATPGVTKSLQVWARVLWGLKRGQMARFEHRWLGFGFRLTPGSCSIVAVA